MASNLPYPNRKIIRVTPTLSTDAYQLGDVFFTATEIPNAVFANGGCSILTNMYILDQSDIADTDLMFIFTQGNTALGAINATANISGDDMEAIGFNTMCFLDASEGATGVMIDDVKIHEAVKLVSDTDSRYPMGSGMMLQAASDSTSVYVQAVLSSATTPTYAADDIQLIFHIEY
tara:strand:- start:89 stop:616 length:528 start_codon:yes stop_codon:yes gene_type:complete